MTHHNHSAGPWDFVAEPGQMVLVYSGNDETMIAEVNALYDNDAETLANAQLIAAAPELLEALRGLVQNIVTIAIYQDLPEFSAARAAIRKATGE
jgi:hypothetical protein